MMGRFMAAASLLAGFALVSATPVIAQNAPLESIHKTLKDESNNEVPYQLFLPENLDKARSYPLLLCLHGGDQMKKPPYEAEVSAA